MIRKPIKRPVKEDLLAEFRADRGQTTTPPKPSEPRSKKPGKAPSMYESFLARFSHLDATMMENFSTRDLVYYFREIAQQNGGHYVIANIKKEMAIMKRVRESYSAKEICAMIEFLFLSEQDYLDKARLSPGILSSSWCNTIYADMQLWVDDQYKPKSAEKTSKRKKSQHEWDSISGDDSKIGVKL